MDISGEQWLFGECSAANSSYRKRLMCREEVRAATISSTASCREGRGSERRSSPRCEENRSAFSSEQRLKYYYELIFTSSVFKVTGVCEQLTQV